VGIRSKRRGRKSLAPKPAAEIKELRCESNESVRQCKLTELWKTAEMNEEAKEVNGDGELRKLEEEL
jgi:hypothetical protein